MTSLSKARYIIENQGDCGNSPCILGGVCPCIDFDCIFEFEKRIKVCRKFIKENSKSEYIQGEMEV